MGRAHEEDDAFTQTLRDNGVEVLYLTDLLAETLEQEDARADCIQAVLDDPRHGETLCRILRRHLSH